jgi:hypothetical protein
VGFALLAPVENCGQTLKMELSLTILTGTKKTSMDPIGRNRWTLELTRGNRQPSGIAHRWYNRLSRLCTQRNYVSNFHRDMMLRRYSWLPRGIALVTNNKLGQNYIPNCTFCHSHSTAPPNCTIVLDHYHWITFDYHWVAMEIQQCQYCWQSMP